MWFPALTHHGADAWPDSFGAETFEHLRRHFETGHPCALLRRNDVAAKLARQKLRSDHQQLDAGTELDRFCHNSQALDEKEPGLFAYPAGTQRSNLLDARNMDTRDWWHRIPCIVRRDSTGGGGESKRPWTLYCPTTASRHHDGDNCRAFDYVMSFTGTVHLGFTARPCALTHLPYW